MPFGICSVLKSFRGKCIRYVSEGLQRVEAMTDDFLVVSCEESLKEANRDHDKEP